MGSLGGVCGLDRYIKTKGCLHQHVHHDTRVAVIYMLSIDLPPHIAIHQIVGA